MALVVAMAAGMLWMFVIAPKIFPRSTPPPKAATAPDEEAGQPPVTQPQAATQPQVRPQPPTTTMPAVAGQIKFRSAAAPPAEPLLMGSADPGPKGQPYYRMQVEITPRGAGVREVLLADFFEATDKLNHYALINPRGREPAWPVDMATAAVTLASLPGSPRVELASADWSASPRVEKDGVQSITLRAEVGTDEAALLDIEKTFTLAKGSYELGVTYRLVNRSPGQDLVVSVESAGVAMIDREGVRDDRELVWAHLTQEKAAEKGTPDVKREGREAVVKEPGKVKLPATVGEPQKLYGLTWAAVGNKFFAAVVRPTAVPAGTALNFSVAGLQGGGRDDERFEIRWSADKVVAPAASGAASQPAGELSFSNYFGPKERRLFTDNSTPYVRLNYVELINYGSCTIPFCLSKDLVTFMLWLLRVLHAAVGNYGVAIMILVVIVRVLLHPLTKKSQVSMAKMAKLQPKMEELKKQYGDDKAEYQKAMAEFYRKEGFSPVLGCLPMLLQMPIWIALWGGLNASIELRHAPFFWWIRDLAAPDALYSWTSPANGYNLPLIGGMLGPIYALNVLPILLMVAMFLQQLLTPKTSTGPQAQQQRFMMYFMTLFFGLLFYGMPSGLTLYVMASTAVGVGEQFVIKRHIKQHEEAEARGELPKKKEKLPPPPGRSNRPRRK